MGIDVTLKAKVTVTDDELADMQKRLYERFENETPYTTDYRYPDLERCDFDGPDIIELTTLHRYYGPGYERGNWEHIRDMGDWLAVEVGERGEVRYGGDAADDWGYLQPWPIARKENDAHWEAVQNEPYHGRRVEWGDG